MARRIREISRSRPLLLVAMLSAAAAPSAHAAGDAARGQTLFAGRCAVCHTTTTQNKVGPGLADVLGRLAGTAPSFHYSKAMTAYGQRWDEHNLDSFLASPSKVVAGTKMAAVPLNAADRADIVAYLKGLKSAR